MNYILDTHALIWFLENNPKLSNRAKTEIENVRNRCFVSVASFWEIAIKVSLQKLTLRHDFSRLFDYCEQSDIQTIDISPDHLQKLLQLDFHHKDPFDRLLIAQAQCEQMTIITKDETFAQYKDAEVLW